MRFSKTLLATAMGFLPVAVRGDDGFWFWRLGHMDGPHISSKALGISRDGNVVVGATNVVGNLHGWRADIEWFINTVATPPLYNELQVQEDVGVIAPSRPSAAYASSNMTCDGAYAYDKPGGVLEWCGSTVVGSSMQGKVSYGTQWFAEVLLSVDDGDYLAIPDFGGGISDMKINDVSADSTILVGTGNTQTGPQAFVANRSQVDTSGVVPILVKLTIIDSVTGQKLKTSLAQTVSADGKIITGFGSLGKQGNRGFVTTVVDATAVPPVLVSSVLPVIGGGKFSEAYTLTIDPITDRLFIAGRSDSPKGPIACIWFYDDITGAWVVKGLGSLSEKYVDSMATDMTFRSGSLVGELIVVGRSRTNLYPSEAFVWTGNPVLEEEEIGYFYDLEYILTKTGVGELSGFGSDWVLNQATGISADGERIVGWGINPEGGEEAWLVTGYPYDELVFTHE